MESRWAEEAIKAADEAARAAVDVGRVVALGLEVFGNASRASARLADHVECAAGKLVESPRQLRHRDVDGARHVAGYILVNFAHVDNRQSAAF